MVRENDIEMTGHQGSVSEHSSNNTSTYFQTCPLGSHVPRVHTADKSPNLFSWIFVEQLISVYLWTSSLNKSEEVFTRVILMRK